MSIKDLPADVASVEPDGAVGLTNVPDNRIDSTDQDRHVPPDESPDSGPPIAELVGEEPITDDGKRAVKYGSSRYEQKRRVVAELLARGLDDLARRVASCDNNGFRCQRPHLCRICHRSKRYDAKQRHADWVKQWDGHVLLALTMPETRSHPTVARMDVFDRFQTVRRRTNFKRAVSRGFGGIHTVQDDNGEFRAHVDLLVECAETRSIRSDVADVWSDVGGGHVEATTVTAQSDATYTDAVEATTCYVIEKTDLPVSAQIDYATVRPDGAHNWMMVGSTI